MTMQTGPLPDTLSRREGIAAGSTDTLLLIGRVLFGWIFIAAGWGKLMNMGGFAGYLTTLGAPAPGLLSFIVPPLEFIIGVMLVLGIATRYAAVATFVFVLLATALAHRYWDYPAAQQTAQFNNFLKNLSIMGGAIFVFVTGGGRYSLDGWLKGGR